jgi:hypothetical protein
MEVEFKVKVPSVKKNQQEEPVVDESLEEVNVNPVDATTLAGSENTVQEDSNDTLVDDELKEDTDEDTEEKAVKDEDEIIETAPFTEDVKLSSDVKSSEVTFTAQAKETKIPDQRVKIKLSRDYSCSIGGQRYNFDKDKVYPVPRNVRDVLSEEENLLKPL